MLPLRIMRPSVCGSLDWLEFELVVAEPTSPGGEGVAEDDITWRVLPCIPGSGIASPVANAVVPVVAASLDLVAKAARIFLFSASADSCAVSHVTNVSAVIRTANASRRDAITAYRDL